jgi:hypothetical protein
MSSSCESRISAPLLGATERSGSPLRSIGRILSQPIDGDIPDDETFKLRMTYGILSDSDGTALRQSPAIVLNPTALPDRKRDRSEAQTAGSAHLGFWLPEHPDLLTHTAPPRRGRRRPVDNSSIGCARRVFVHNGRRSPRRFMHRRRRLRPAYPPSYPQLDRRAESPLYSSKFFGILGLVRHCRSYPQHGRHSMIITAVELSIRS